MFCRRSWCQIQKRLCQSLNEPCRKCSNGLKFGTLREGVRLYIASQSYDSRGLKIGKLFILLPLPKKGSVSIYVYGIKFVPGQMGINGSLQIFCTTSCICIESQLTQSGKGRKPYSEEHRKAVYGRTVCTV